MEKIKKNDSLKYSFTGLKTNFLIVYKAGLNIAGHNKSLNSIFTIIQI